MTLTDFLLARIAEDEAAARHSLDGDIEYLPSLTTKHGDVIYLGVTHPARVLAECAAKRAILFDEVPDGPTADYVGGWRDARMEYLRLLVQPYASHPDFDPEWLL